MRTQLMSVLGVCLLAIAIAAPVVADEERPPFSETELEKFLEDWPRFTEWADERGRSLESISSPSMLMGAALSFDAGSFLESRGWEPERFYYVAGRSWMAVLVLEARDQAPEMIAGIDGAIKEVRNEPDLTPEQKAEMIAEFEEMKAMFMGIDSYFEVDAGELELVKARRDRVKDVLDIE